jgi:hypothetical protein
MEKIIAMTFDIADQRCKMYNALEWGKFIAKTIQLCIGKRLWGGYSALVEVKALFTIDTSEYAVKDLENLLEEAYGDEFWYEVGPYTKNVHQVAFDLRSEEFVICEDDNEVDFVMEMVADAGDEDEIFWEE